MNGQEEWNTLIRSLPDPAFMEIMNNYLGGVETPYDKNDLLDKLAVRLTRHDYIKALQVSLGPTDLKILSAARWFGQASLQDLINLFGPFMAPAEIQNRLISLEERLLLFFRKAGGKPGYILSPLLPQEILDRLSPYTIVEIRETEPPVPRVLPLINGSFLICFFSLLKEDLKICNNDGSFKKRFTSALTQIFPAAGFSDEPNERLHLLLNALKTLKLLSESAGQWKFRINNLKTFSRLNGNDQLLWVWAALCTSSTAKLASCMTLISTLASQFPSRGGLETKELEKMVQLLQIRVIEREENMLSPAHMVRILKLFNFFHTDGQAWYIHPMVTELLGKTAPESPAFFLQATFDANLTPESPFSLPLALSLTCERYDAFAQLTLSSLSFRNFLKAGLSLEELQMELDERFSVEIPQNILFSLKDWEENYHSIRLWEGVVLEVGRERIPLIERSARLKNLIKRELGEGYYLLAKEDRHEWELALAEIGLDSVPALINPGARVKAAENYTVKLTDHPPLFPPGKNNLPSDTDFDLSYREPLKEMVLNHKSLSDEEKEELLSRIERGVLYREDQIQPAAVRKELTTVKGLDYQGKLRMIKAVMGNRAYQLDVTLPTEDYDLITHRIIPRSLEQGKDNQDDILFGTELPDKSFSCPVRKISKVRKIRTSLF